MSGSTVVRSLVLGAVVGLLALQAPGPVAADPRSPGQPGPDDQAPTDEGIRIVAEAGFGGAVADGRAYPVVVTVSTDRLVQATLQVELLGPGKTTLLERQVEVAGGNSATFRLLVPGAIEGAVEKGFPGDRSEITARLVEDEGSDALATTSVPVDSDPAQELVGVLPEALAATGPEDSLPGAVPLLVDVGVARLEPVDPEVLQLGELALEPLDQLVASPGELAALPDEHRAAVIRWVESGGHLLLPGDAAAIAVAEDVLPEGWLPAADDGVRAGLGQVRSVPAAWQDRLLPTPTRSGTEEAIISDSVIWANDTVSGSLSGDAGVRLPPAGRLGVMLAVYVLVIGPLAYVVLRRVGRRQLAWAAVPVLALTSTGMVVGTGGTLRRTSASAHVTVYETGAGGATATTWSLLSNPRRQGAVGVVLPEGWTATDGFAEWESMGSPVRVRQTAEGTEATTEPPAGGFGLIQSQGPAAADMADALVVNAESAADDTIRGTVRNNLDVELQAVAVLVGRAALADIGTLAPGEERAFEVTGAARFELQADPEREVWPDDMNGVEWRAGPGGGGGFVVVEKVPMAEDDAVIVDKDAFEQGAGVAGGVRTDVIAVNRDGAIEAQAIESTGPAPSADVVDPTAPGVDASGADVAGADEVVGGAQPGPPPLPMPPPPMVEPGKGGVVRIGPDGGRSESGDHPSVMAAWSAVMRHTGWNYRPPGQVVAVGWTEELAPPVTTDGSGDVARSRSAVVARATATPAADRLTDTAVVRSTVRGPLTEESVDGDIPAVVAFDLPSSVDGRPVDLSRLALNLPGKFITADVWTSGGWVALPDVPDSEVAQVDLPAGAVVGGQVFVRWHHPQEPPPPGRDLVLYEKEAP